MVAHAAAAAPERGVLEAAPLPAPLKGLPATRWPLAAPSRLGRRGAGVPDRAEGREDMAEAGWLEPAPGSLRGVGVDLAALWIRRLASRSKAVSAAEDIPNCCCAWRMRSRTACAERRTLPLVFT